MIRRFWAVIAAGLLTVSTGCGKSGGGSDGPELTPTSPSSNTGGGWTGTLSRPEGKPSIAVSWQATQGGSFLSGPMTLTYGGNSVTVMGSGEMITTDNRATYTIFIALKANPGEIASLPNCQIIGGALARPGVAFPAPFQAITAAPVTINYTSCQGFIDPPPQRTSVTESSQLTLTKQ